MNTLNNSALDDSTDTEESVAIPCEHCSEECADNPDAFQIDGQHYCSRDCAQAAGFAYAENRDEWYPEDEVVTCYNGTTYHIDDTVYIESEGEYYPEDSHRISFAEDTQRYELAYNCSVWNDTLYTDAWLEENTFRCEECSERYELDEMEYDEDGERCICVHCAPRLRGKIYPYRTCVVEKLGMAPNPKKALTFGVELEIEQGDGDRSEIAEALLAECKADVILKEDGSLDYGFEIVSRPAPIEHTANVLCKAAEIVRKNGGKSFKTTTCGFHVHIGREYLTDLQIGKMLAFLQNWQNKGLLEKVAMRQCERWAKIGQNYKVTQKPNDRYTGLNLSNAKTIEFRIFKGNLNTDTLRAYLSFIDCLVSWSATCSLMDCISWEKFIVWCQLPNNRKQSKLFISWAMSKNIVKQSPKMAARTESENV